MKIDLKSIDALHTSFTAKGREHYRQEISTCIHFDWMQDLIIECLLTHIGSLLLHSFWTSCKGGCLLRVGVVSVS